MKKLKILLPVLVVIFVVLVFAFSLLSGTEKISNASGFAMGSPVNVTIYGIKDGCPCINGSRLLYMRKNYYEQNCDLKSSQYIKISVRWEIGIGVILYEKGKGKFVGDWKNHRTEIINKLKEFCVQRHADKLIS